MKRSTIVRSARRAAMVVVFAAGMNWVVGYLCARWFEAQAAVASAKRLASLGPRGGQWWEARPRARWSHELELEWPVAPAAGWPGAPEEANELEYGYFAETVASAHDFAGQRRMWYQHVSKTGWPWHGIWCADKIVMDTSTYATAYELEWCLDVPQKMEGIVGMGLVPFGIRPAAFAANTAVYAVVLGALAIVPGRVRKWRRARRGCCPECGYPIGASPVCTECGAGVRV